MKQKISNGSFFKAYLVSRHENLLIKCIQLVINEFTVFVLDLTKLPYFYTYMFYKKLINLRFLLIAGLEPARPF
jgi:hypothetical protein